MITSFSSNQGSSLYTQPAWYSGTPWVKGEISQSWAAPQCAPWDMITRSRMVPGNTAIEAILHMGVLSRDKLTVSLRGIQGLALLVWEKKRFAARILHLGVEEQYSCYVQSQHARLRDWFFIPYWEILFFWILVSPETRRETHGGLFVF